MTRRRVAHAGFTYTVALDDPKAVDLRPWAVLRTRVVDELTGTAPPVPISMTTDLRRARPKVADGGICGLVARPVDVSSALVTANSFRARVTAPGYLPRDLTPAIEAARRALNTPAAAGATSLDISPGDPSPRRQFTPGRGIALERTVTTAAEQVTTVRTVAPPPMATDVPLVEPVDVLRAPGTTVAGIPLMLPDQPLHREAALRLRGTVRRLVQQPAGPILVPAVGAAVGILGIWWDYPSSVTGAPLTPDVCALRPTMRLAHPVGASIDVCTLNPSGGPGQLRGYVPVGSDQVLVTPNIALNPLGGDLLRMGDPLTSDDEVVVTDRADAPTGPTGPSRVRLRTPTGLIHRSGESVQLVVETAVAAVGTVAREGLPGDPVLFAAGLTALPTVSTLVIERSSPRAVYYSATQLPSTPNGITFSHQVPLDTAGRFQWPAIARIAQLRIVASLPPLAPVQVDMALDYGGDPTLAIVLT